MPSLPEFPEDGTLVEVTVKGRIYQTPSTAGSVMLHDWPVSGPYNSYIHPNHILEVKEVEIPFVLITGGVYRDSFGQVWQCTNANSSAPVIRAGHIGAYSMSNMKFPIELLWSPPENHVAPDQFS